MAALVLLSAVIAGVAIGTVVVGVARLVVGGPL
jgi:hypothetical protein